MEHQSNKIDIVYALGSTTPEKASPWKNNELRYSLRSLGKHGLGIGKVYLVGDDPGFLNDVIIVPMKDESRYNKEKNIMQKIATACYLPELSDRFLFVNDDHFLLEDTDLLKYPYYYCWWLDEFKKTLQPGNPYLTSVLNTERALNKRAIPTRNFDTHTPIIYRKSNFVKTMRHYDWNQPYGYLIKSLYCNSLYLQPTAINDLKINNPLSASGIRAVLENRTIFSVGNHGLNADMKQYLQERYPDPSPWEKS